MKKLLVLLLLIPSLSWADTKIYLECQVEEDETFTRDKIIHEKSDTKFHIELTIYKNKCLNEPGTANTIRPELSGDCLKARVYFEDLGVCRNLYTINSIEDEITAYSASIGCRNSDTYLKLNRSSGNFKLTHNFLNTCDDCVKKYNLTGSCQKKSPIY